MTPLITAFGAMAARKARKLEATHQVLEEKIRLSEEDPKRVSQEVLQRVAQKMDIGISTLRKYWTECSKTDKSRESQLESTKRHKFHDVQDEEGVVFGIEDLVEIIASINNSHHQRQSTRALSAPEALRYARYLLLISQKLFLFCWMLLLFLQKLFLFCWMLFLFLQKLLLFFWMLFLFCLMQKYILRKSGTEEVLFSIF